ncbi:helix-turn-helix transcriptional regulator [Bradyrhizobium sp. GCM10023182]|uniref:LuxR C-terminal-related transcriptional regulator n=1 Tax=Bradyrhizobium zhengyangense TaxID=2911009 RepID=A0ABS9M1L4_9BRAD|nr:LuxR C-terminal-related transcriptional regulator [Bradyrhizobium zhengyangense]MCG2672792.1 LuxR C-terminal-related transcriptional regulator [Bradyrhizobium zhengyangense]
MNAEILDLIYGAIADSGRWSEVLVGISDYLGALGGMLAHVPPLGSHRTPTQILGRLPEEASKTFREHYAWNPWTVAITKVPFGKAVSANSLIEPGLIEKTAFYADVLQPWGHADIVDISHKALAADGFVGGFGFCLSQRAAERADEYVRKLDPLTPHLCRAFEASLLLGARADGKRQLSTILQLMPNAALLLDRDARIVQANSAAEALLRHSDGVAFSTNGHSQLVAALPSERQALSKLIKEALDVANGRAMSLSGSEPIRLSRPNGATPLLVLAVPLPRPSFAFWELVAPARIIIVIIDQDAKSRVRASLLRSAYGLTTAEARVALLLASGISGRQLTAALGVSPDTIKTHLRRCFEKTGTRSQAELSRVLAMFPAAGDEKD